MRKGKLLLFDRPAAPLVVEFVQPSTLGVIEGFRSLGNAIVECRCARIDSASLLSGHHDLADSTKFKTISPMESGVRGVHCDFWIFEVSAVYFKHEAISWPGHEDPVKVIKVG
jgi:hypothetical protein